MVKHWVILQMPDGGGWRYAQVTGKKNGAVTFGEIIQQPEIPLHCQGWLQLCFCPPEYHVLTDQFVAKKPELRALQIDKRFADLGLAVDGGSFDHREAVHDRAEKEFSCLFVRQENLAEIYSLIRPWKGVKSLRLIPLAAAIAGLFRQVTDKAVIVLLLGKKAGQVLVVQDGCPLYSQVLVQVDEGGPEESLVAHALDFARMSVRRMHEIDEFHIVRVGQFRKNLDLERLGIQEWCPDFSSVYPSVSTDDILDMPGLFGLEFADSAYNFLPRDYALSWKMQEGYRMMAVAAGIAGGLLLGGWLYLHAELASLKAGHQQLLTDISMTQQKIRSEMPEGSKLNTFDRLLSIRELTKKEFRLDSFIRMLSIALPPQVSVVRFDIRRDAVGAGENDPVSLPGDVRGINGDVREPAMKIPRPMAEQILGRGINISLTAVSDGSREEVVDRFEMAIKKMHGLFAVHDASWSYREADHSGLLHCEFSPLAGEVLE